MSMALRKHKNYMPEDVAEAIIITSLNSDGKRHRGEYNNELYPAKRHATHLVIESADLKDINTAKPDASTSSPPNQNWVLKPAPYFYYTDRSRQPDDEPWTPLTPHGLVPTFPAKMHEILSNEELSSIIEWLPHGRAWRVLNARMFEIHVLPRYFDHNKFSSFIRQTNGWGFRRLTQGYDRGAYYHEYFLKDLPHLSKKMTRPKVAEKKTIEPQYEPDFYAISRECPLPCIKRENYVSYPIQVNSPTATL